MNKATKSLFLISPLALSMLASCSNGAVVGLSVSTISACVIGDYINLDDFVTVTHENGATSDEYTVDSSSSKLTFDGHKVTSSEVGLFTLTFEAGDYTKTAQITFVKNSKEDLVSFLEPLKTNPYNYTVSLSYNSTDYGTYHHTKDYVIGKSKTISNQDSIVARLSDGKGYFGTVNIGEVNSVSFQNGYINIDNFIYLQGLEFDADTEFSYTTINKRQYLYADKTVENKFLSAAQISLSGAGYTATGLLFNGIENGNAYFTALATYNGASYQLFNIVLSNVGTAGADWIQTIVDDKNSVPAPIDSSEIVDTFKAIDEAKNYTITTEIFDCDENGQQVTKPTSNVDLLYTIFGTTYYKSTVSFDDNGMIASNKLIKEKEEDDYSDDESESTDTSSSSEESGSSESDSSEDELKTVEVNQSLAYWDDDAEVWQSASVDGGETWTTPYNYGTKSDVYETDLLNNYRLSSIKDQYITDTNWISKANDGSVYTFTGYVGDSDGKVANNLLFRELIDLSRYPIYSTDSNSIELGDYLCASNWYIDTEGITKYSWSYISEYKSFIVDTSSKTVDVLAYINMGSSDYIACHVTINNVGTTTNTYPSNSAN